MKQAPALGSLPHLAISYARFGRNQALARMGESQIAGRFTHSNIGSRLNHKPTTIMKDETKQQIELSVEELEERIAPSAIGNPGNNNPPRNNTNNPGNEGTFGKVSTGN